MSRRTITYITNGFGNPVNYHVPGPMGNQFASPFGDPYRVNSVGFSLGGIWSGLTNLVGSIGKIAAPVLPGLVQVGVGSLLTKSPQGTAAATQQPAQSGFTVSVDQARLQADAAAAEKKNMVIYAVAGAAIIFTAYYFISKRRR